MGWQRARVGVCVFMCGSVRRGRSAYREAGRVGGGYAE